MQAEVVKTFDADVLQNILSIERSSFPKAWIYDKAEEYYGRMLSAKANINILLTETGQKIGYLLAIPHNDAVKDLSSDDPKMEGDLLKYYIETIAIRAEYRGKKGFSILLGKLIEECKKRGIHKISMHARVSNHLSEIIQKKLAITEIRRIEKWAYYNFEEPTDYIEATI